jgi:hypothetical protein
MQAAEQKPVAASRQIPHTLLFVRVWGLGTKNRNCTHLVVLLAAVVQATEGGTVLTIYAGIHLQQHMPVSSTQESLLLHLHQDWQSVHTGC